MSCTNAEPTTVCASPLFFGVQVYIRSEVSSLVLASFSQERQRIQGAGILDLNWSRSHDRALYLADSRGRLHEHRLESADPDSGSRLGEGRSVDLASEDDGVLALSLDISDRRSPSAPLFLLTLNTS